MIISILASCQSSEDGDLDFIEYEHHDDSDPDQPRRPHGQPPKPKSDHWPKHPHGQSWKNQPSTINSKPQSDQNDMSPNSHGLPFMFTVAFLVLQKYTVTRGVVESYKESTKDVWSHFPPVNRILGHFPIQNCTAG